MKYGVFNEQGFPVGFYATDIHGDAIPSGATGISEEQWREFIENPGTRRWVNGAVVAYDPPPPSPVVPRVVAMWRARTIMKVTPWGEGTLFDAVVSAIASMPDPLEKAAAEEALERGTEFDLDGQVVPRLMTAVGMEEPQVLDLMAQAAALPA